MENIINTKKKAKKLSSLIPLGWREWVFLPSYNLKLKAKIDTGARISSIHASNIQVYQKRKVDMVNFRLFYSKSSSNVETELIGYKKIKSSFGETELRPMIHLEIKIGSETWVTEITLAQRSNLTYPMLIGRNTLTKRHIVYCRKSFLTGKVSRDTK
tara:strand:+ start:2571 stop:3041 length:471 start_codon:yes stop_codon:yes gene_type:complete